MIKEYQLFNQTIHAEDTEQVVNILEIAAALFSPGMILIIYTFKNCISPELFLAGIADQRITATLMAGYDGHRGWLNYLAVHPEYQRCGFCALKIIIHAIDLLKSLECPKINLQVRNNKILVVIEFYRKLGFTEHEVSSMQLRFVKGKNLLETFHDLN
jgi:ribosomal protein S18 acetylase RimI-like enzyme